MRTATSEEVFEKLKALRDKLLAENIENTVQGDRWASGFNSGVEAMWEATKDAVGCFLSHE